jgi:putative MATE family efflux protein
MSFIKNLIKPPYTQDQLLSEVPVSKAIPLMSIPAVTGVLMILFTTLIGAYFVGMLHSEPALAAVGIVYPITLLSTTIAMIFGAGLAASIGRHLGAGNKEKCNRLASSMFMVCSAAAFVFVSLGIAFCSPLFRALGAAEEVLLYARDYFVIQLIAIFFSACSQFLNYIASAESNMKLGAAAFIGSSLLHVLLTPIFMFALGMGLRGAAISSLVSQLASALILLTPYIRKKMLIELSVKNIRLERGMTGEVVRSGLPLGITQILMALSIALTNILGRTVLAENSVSFIAGYGIAVKAVVMVQYLLISYMIGFQAVAAYSYGAKNRERFWDAYRHSRNVMLISDFVIAVLFAAFSGPLMRMFSGEPEIIRYGSAMITSMCLSLVISFPLPAVITCFQATGKGGIGAFVSSLRQGVCYIPLILALPRLFQVWGFYVVQPVSDIFTVTVALLMFARFRKRLALEFEGAVTVKPTAE